MVPISRRSRRAIFLTVFFFKQNEGILSNSSCIVGFLVFISCALLRLLLACGTCFFFIFLFSCFRDQVVSRVCTREIQKCLFCDMLPQVSVASVFWCSEIFKSAILGCPRTFGAYHEKPESFHVLVLCGLPALILSGVQSPINHTRTSWSGACRVSRNTYLFTKKLLFFVSCYVFSIMLDFVYV